MGRFDDRAAPMPGPVSVLRMLSHRSRALWQNQRTRLAPQRATWSPAKADDVAVTWVGHATFLIEGYGLNILTDPIWAMRLPGGMRRTAAPGIAWEDLPTLHAATVSHNHHDHMHAPTLQRLPRDVALCLPQGMERWGRRRGFDTRTLDWYGSTQLQVGDTTARITFVPSHHWSQRGLFDRNASLWGGWVIELEAPGKPTVTLHHAGDTAYGPRFLEVGGRFDIDATMMPIGGYEPRWFMQDVHIAPEEAVRAASELGAGTMIPMHYATYPLTTEPVLEPIQRARAAASEAGMDLADLAIGGTWRPKAPRGRARVGGQ